MELLPPPAGSTEGAPAHRRVIVYADGAGGLGHLHRTLTVLHRVVDADPGVTILLLTGLPVEPYFTLPEGCDTVRLPSRGERAAELRRALVLAAAQSFHPDVALVAALPLGDELEATLFALRRAGCRLVFGLDGAERALAAPERPPLRTAYV
jgi:predicted glycosyltransferase